VCALFGGPMRTELEVYWSHCGSFRVAFHEHLQNPMSGKQTPPLTSTDDCRKIAEDVKKSGFKALKTNIFLFDEEGGPQMYMPGFGGGGNSPELNLPPRLTKQLVAQMRAFREGAGDDVGLKLDLNYNFKTEGFIQIAKALTPEALGGTGIDWLELDSYNPQALRQIRDNAPMPIASLEGLMGRSAIKPFLEAGAVDVAIIDVLWNGMSESCKMADLCELYEVNCAAHNYHGWLGTAISAHFCAAIPNYKVLEVDVDDVPWKDEIVTFVPSIVDGKMTLPLKPGWGIDVNEEALAKYPPIGNPKTGIWSAATEACR